MKVCPPHPLKKILQSRGMRYEDAAKLTGYSRDRFEMLLNGRDKMSPRAKLLFDAAMTQLVKESWTE